MRDCEGTEADFMEDWSDEADDYFYPDGTFTANQSVDRDRRFFRNAFGRKKAIDNGKALVRYPDGSIREETVVYEFHGRVITKERQLVMLRLYSEAKAAKIGSVVYCPLCGVKHTKTTYHKVFCSNGKKTKKDCKSKYHNMIHPERLDRL